LLQAKRTFSRVEEGSESADFWSGLGGQAEYASSKDLETGEHDPRLFVLSSISGQLKIEELVNFSQDDLLNDDVMILDAHSEVYVWVGRDANPAEKEGALAAALDYVKKAPDGRDPDTAVFQVAAGSEPPSFTCHFLGWDPTKAQDFSDPYAKKLAAAKGGAAPAAESKAAPKPAPAAVRVVAVTGQFLDPATNKFSAADIRSGAAQGVDPKSKEAYLSAQEFQSLFGTTLDEFSKQPGWKKEQAKKKNGLF